MKFRFVVAEKAQFPVSLLCRTVGVTRQEFYAWQRRLPSQRSVEDAALLERIRQIHTETNRAYGAPRIFLDLRDEGVHVGRKRIARLMRADGLRGADGTRGGPQTTVREPAQPSAPDLVDRRFARDAPNQLWVCDIKYVQTGQGFLFLAAAQDVFSRRIVGWSMRDDLQAELVLDALAWPSPLAAPSLPAWCAIHQLHDHRYPRATEPISSVRVTRPTVVRIVRFPRVVSRRRSG